MSDLNTLTALADFRYALRKFLRFSKEYLASYSLTPEQYEVLLALRAAPEPLTIGSLSERLQVKHHTAISLVNKLAAHHLIHRVPSHADRRVVHLELSTIGQSLIEKLAAAHYPRVCQTRDEIVAALKNFSREDEHIADSAGVPSVEDQT
jgi:DNA-binding MarR family transcriptional regulator